MDLETAIQADHSPLEDLRQLEAEVSESFEALVRVIDSQRALMSLRECYSVEAAESVLTAIYAGTAYVDDLPDYSEESVKNLIVEGFKAIVEAIRRFFDNFIEFLNTADLSSIWLQRKVTVIERRALAYRGRTPSEDSVVIGRLSRYLRVGRLYADDSLKLERELKELHRAIQVSNKDLIDTLIKGAEEIPSTSRGKTGSDLEQALTHLVGSLSFSSIASKYSMSSAPAGRFNRTGILASPPLLGGKTIFYLQGKLSEKGTKAFRFHGFMVEDSTEDRLPIDPERHFRTLAPAELTSIPGTTRDILTAISRGSNAPVRARVSRTKNTLENYVRSLSQNVEYHQTDLDAIKRTVSAFTYWLQSVNRPINAISVSVCRAVIAYCDASMATYK